MKDQLLRQSESQSTAAEKSAHSPTPWIIKQPGQFDKERIAVVFSNGQSIENQPVYSAVAFIGVNRSLNMRNQPGEREQANARLIAAAPDLLESVKAAKHQIEHLANHYMSEGFGEWIVNNPALIKVRAAITKAEGKAQ